MGKGGGKRKGSKGKGKGRGKKRRREEEDDGEGAGSTGKGKGKGERAKQKAAAKAAAAAAALAAEQAAEEERKRAAARRAKPGFGKLLESFGVVDSDDGADSDEDESDEEAADEGAEEELAEGDELGEGPGMLAGEEGEEEEEKEFDEAIEEDEEDEEEEDGAEEVEMEAGSSGLDFYSRFWDDPPQPLGSSNGSAGKASSGMTRFTLPGGLDRCEAHGCDASALLLELLENPKGSRGGSSGSGSGTSADARSKSGRSLSKLHAKEAHALLQSPWNHCRLAPGLLDAFKAWVAKENDGKEEGQDGWLDLGPREGALFLYLHAYLDVGFPQQSHLNAKAVRAALALHIADHVLKAKGEERSNTLAASTGAEAASDQGFSRTRVLVLCPFRSACYEIVNLILALMPGKKQVAHMQRFKEEFGPEDDDQPMASKPADWQHLFGGNSDDRFRVGLAVWKKGIRLYAPFEKSDILFCSPLGLRQITGVEGERKREFDFLSSIEVCVVERADVLRMQNWEHVQEVMQVVNRKPQGLAGIDISRLRAVFAEGRAREFRQTVVTSCGQSLDADALFGLSCDPPASAASEGAAGESLATRLRRAAAPLKLGRAKKGRRTLELEGDEDQEAAQLEMSKSAKKGGSGERGVTANCRGLAKLVAPPEGEPLRQATTLGISRQFFLHTPCDSLAEQSDQLFETFESRYWRPLGSTLEGLLVVASTYYNFLRLRRFFREEGTSFSSVFEYSKNQDLSRARFRFFHGERRLMLVTERFLWYRRYRLKGANSVLFYGAPETPDVYEEVLGAVRVPSQCNSMCLFTKHDAFALERIVGQDRARTMLTSPPGKVFVYT